MAENLHKNVLEMMKNCKEKGEKVEAFKAAYLRTDRDFLQEVNKFSIFTDNNPWIRHE